MIKHRGVDFYGTAWEKILGKASIYVRPNGDVVRIYDEWDFTSEGGGTIFAAAFKVLIRETQPDVAKPFVTVWP